MFKSLFQKAVRSRSLTVVNRIKPYISKTDKLLDIGSGTGDVAYLLQKVGYNVTPLDVADFHGPRLLETTIYDGVTMPFADKTFDKALLLMVMHHTPNPEVILKEALRVAKELVVIETSYVGKLDRAWTIISDTIGNLRLEAFWESYKTDKEWRELFGKLGLEVADSHEYQDGKWGLPFLHIGYYLKKH